MRKWGGGGALTEELAELRKKDLLQLCMLNKIQKPSASHLQPKSCKKDAHKSDAITRELCLLMSIQLCLLKVFCLSFHVCLSMANAKSHREK